MRGRETLRGALEHAQDISALESDNARQDNVIFDSQLPNFAASVAANTTA